MCQRKVHLALSEVFRRDRKEYGLMPSKLKRRASDHITMKMAGDRRRSEEPVLYFPLLQKDRKKSTDCVLSEARNIEEVAKVRRGVPIHGRDLHCRKEHMPPSPVKQESIFTALKDRHPNGKCQTMHQKHHPLEPQDAIVTKEKNNCKHEISIEENSLSLLTFNKKPTVFDENSENSVGKFKQEETQEKPIDKANAAITYYADDSSVKFNAPITFKKDEVIPVQFKNKENELGQRESIGFLVPYNKLEGYQPKPGEISAYCLLIPVDDDIPCNSKACRKSRAKSKCERSNQHRKEACMQTSICDRKCSNLMPTEEERAVTIKSSIFCEPQKRKIRRKNVSPLRIGTVCSPKGPTIIRNPQKNRSCVRRACSKGVVMGDVVKMKTKNCVVSMLPSKDRRRLRGMIKSGLQSLTKRDPLSSEEICHMVCEQVKHGLRTAIIKHPEANITKIQDTTYVRFPGRNR